MAGMRSDQAWGTWDDIAKCAASSKKDSCLRAIGRFRPADRSDSLEIHSNCKFTEIRRRSAKRKDPWSLAEISGHMFITLRLLSGLRRRGASRGRPVKWFALVPRVMRVCPKTRNAKRFF